MDTYTLHDPEFGELTMPARLTCDRRSLKTWAHFFGSGEFMKMPLTVKDIFHLMGRSAYYLTSCKERRSTEIESQSFAQFFQIDKLSPPVSRFFDRSPELFAGVPAKDASGWVFACKVLAQGMGGLTSTGAVRVLDGPTSAVFLDPWQAHLEAAGVEFRLNTKILGLQVNAQGDKIISIRVQDQMTGRIERISIQDDDVVISGLSVQHTPVVVTPDIDPRGALAAQLETHPMIGVQMHFPTPLSIQDHQILYHSPWGIILFGQGDHVWPKHSIHDMTKGKSRYTLSMAFVNMDTPGLLGKTVRQCETLVDIEAELKAQLVAAYRGTKHGDVAEAITLDDVAFSHSDELQLGADGRIFHYGEELMINKPGDLAIQVAMMQVRKLLNLEFSTCIRDAFGLESMEGAAARGVSVANKLLSAQGRTPKYNVPDYELCKPLRLARILDRWRFMKAPP
ncbi:MAG: hypothetical protein O3A01_08910 [bacterium]|nr:hypothetical protein [bacterium]